MVRQVTNYNSITPGKTYRISAWVRAANVQNPAGWYVFGVWVFNNDSWAGDSKMPQQETLNYDWREISWTITAPAGINRAAAVLTRHTDGDAWYDDVYIGEVLPGAPVISLDPDAIEHRIVPGEAIAAEVISVQDTGGGILDATVSSNQSWLMVSPGNVENSGETDEVTLSYSVAGLGSGIHHANITLTDPLASNSPQTVVVTVIVGTPGDFDLDGDVDMSDFGEFQLCYTGEGIEQNDPACTSARLDPDPDVDLDDFTIFQNCLSGADVPADPNCAG
jgi:hypothetical protein